MWINLDSVQNTSIYAGSAADLGGGGGGGGRVRTPFLSGILPPADPKGPPLYYFEISIFADGS